MRDPPDRREGLRLLWAERDGELDEAGRARLEGLLREDPELARDRRRLLRLDGALGTAPEPPVGAVGRVLDAVAAGRAGGLPLGAVPARPGMGGGGRPFALAAGLLAAAALLAFLVGGRDPAPAPAPEVARDGVPAPAAAPERAATAVLPVEAAPPGAGVEALRRVPIRVEAPGARSVGVAGTFNHWDPDSAPLERGADGSWRGELRVPSGRYEYSLVFDGARWEPDPAAADVVPDGWGRENSVLVVP